MDIEAMEVDDDIIEDILTQMTAIRIGSAGGGYYTGSGYR